MDTYHSERISTRAAYTKEKKNCTDVLLWLPRDGLDCFMVQASTSVAGYISLGADLYRSCFHIEKRNIARIDSFGCHVTASIV
jgi:hypothetical protein